MLLVNLATIYQGRIPTLTHTQQHAEALSRSHLNYLLTGELDTFVNNLIQNLTTPPQHVTRTLSRRNKHTQPTSTDTPLPTQSPTIPTTRKRTYTTTHNKTHYHPYPPIPTQTPKKKSQKARRQHTHLPARNPNDIELHNTKIPTTNNIPH
jgi:hypothetical protein